MLRPLHTRSLALGAALVVASWGAVAVPASAEPGSGNAGQHAHSADKGQAQSANKGQANSADKKAGKGKGNGSSGNHAGGNAGSKGSGDKNAGGNKGKGHAGGNKGKGHAGGNKGNGNAGGNKGNGNAGGNKGNGNAGGNKGNGNSGGNKGNAGGNKGNAGGGQDKGKGGGSKGDPAGNNGTVKIAPLGEMDGIPNNSPHPGCAFQVEWYGFDQGDDIVSTVSFAMHAPTQDVGLSVAGDTSVFVGGDPASGAGTATGLDGTEVYTLSFDGEPHPKQGYHVKLTVHTPRSNGNDSKTKVFWVEPCEAPAGEIGSDEGESTTPGTGDETDTGTDTGSDVGSGSEGDTTADGGGDIDVLGEQASAVAGAESGADVSPAEAAGESAGDDANVPTAVDAGENGQSALDWVRSPLPLLVIALGAVLAAAAFVTRRRTRVQAGE